MYLTKDQLSQITQQITPQETEYVTSVNTLVNNIGTEEYKNNLVTLTAKSEEDATVEAELRKKSIVLLNTMMAFRDKFQNLHWSSTNMSYHKSIDEFISKFNDDIDEFAELVQGIFGQFSGGEIVSLTLPTSEDPIENLIQLRDCIAELLKEIVEIYDNKESEILSLSDKLTSIQEVIFKYIYLFRICKNN